MWRRSHLIIMMHKGLVLFLQATPPHPSLCYARSTPFQMRGDNNWHRAREAAHAALLTLTRDCLTFGPRKLLPENVHVESAVQLMPQRYGFESSLLTPDIIAFDERNAEVLVIEATICPEPALPRYIGRKRHKYHKLCATATPEAPLRVAPPLVVAIGTSGAVPESTRETLAALLMLDVEAGHDAVEEDGEVDDGLVLGRGDDAQQHVVSSGSPRVAGSAISGSTGSGP